MFSILIGNIFICYGSFLPDPIWYDICAAHKMAIERTNAIARAHVNGAFKFAFSFYSRLFVFDDAFFPYG